MQITDTTPVIIAAGQVVDRLGEKWRRLSPADLAAEAVQTTLDGTGIKDLASQVDQVMVMRTFVDSVPGPPKKGNPPVKLTGRSSPNSSPKASIASITATGKQL